ncbi:MAG: PhzF family phenazine biosynthesis protein [Oscillospiraceae bacterium]|nr:PhzF family phenazine biosynthesis protein [Oscillospiraceae bacterium]
MRQYIVDAFTDELFKGNTAAVCILDRWIDDLLMQNVAKENNFSETAFAVKEGGAYHLRWFTPGGEIDFCGHATLAAAYVIENYTEPGCGEIKFHTMSGEIPVKASGGLFEMDFPRYHLNEVAVTDKMTQAIGIRPLAAYLDRDLLLVVDSEEAVFNLNPNQLAMKELDGLCIAVTAKGSQYDCVSRVFAPELDVPEDPVTGSTHCMIVPYWAKRLNQNRITAFQASARTGVLYAELKDDRVKISGKAVLFGIADIL